jgi:hypothetical protein
MPLQGIPDSRSLAAPPTEFPDLKLHSHFGAGVGTGGAFVAIRSRGAIGTILAAQ